MLDALRQASQTLSIALSLVEAEREAGRDDGDRLAAYTERNRPGTRGRIEGLVRNYYEPADSALLRDMIVRIQTLPAGRRIAPIDSRIRAPGGPEEINALVRTLVAGSRLIDSASVLAAFDDPPATVPDMPRADDGPRPRAAPAV